MSGPSRPHVSSAPARPGPSGDRSSQRHGRRLLRRRPRAAPAPPAPPRAGPAFPARTIARQLCARLSSLEAPGTPAQEPQPHPQILLRSPLEVLGLQNFFNQEHSS